MKPLEWIVTLAIGIPGALLALAFIHSFVGAWWTYTYAPTPDQIYGCSIRQSAPNGECL